MQKSIAILLLVLLAVPAFAEKPKSNEVYVPGAPHLTLAVIAEVEPNDDAATASGPLGAGDQGTGTIDPALEVDYWTLNIDATGTWILGTDAGADPAMGDSKLYLFDSDGVTQLAFDDDGGPGLYSQITFNFAAAGTYYLEVVPYGSSNVGSYVLDVAAPVAAPENDTCAGAIAIVPEAGFSVAISTVGANNDYSPVAPSCTGYSADGADVVYTVELEPTEDITLSWTTVGFDGSLYVVTDCDDLTTCVAGADAAGTGGTEVVSFTNDTSTTNVYYIICDAYSGTGDGTLTVDETVATEPASWGSVKSLYR